jgi:hypothetical protein
MRSLAFASLLFAAALGACSAVDNFDKFKFVDDGGTGGDMTGQPPGFGQPCTDQCQTAVASRPLTCLKTINGETIPGGMCTRQCSPGTAIACSEYPDAVCTHIESMDLCLPRCDASLGRGCRTGLACCDNRHIVSLAGACAPPNTDLCK